MQQATTNIDCAHHKRRIPHGPSVVSGKGEQTPVGIPHQPQGHAHRNQLFWCTLFKEEPGCGFTELSVLHKPSRCHAVLHVAKEAMG